MDLTRTIVVAALLCTSLNAHATSFDCVKAVRPVERAICADPKLSAADSAMAAAYRADLQRLPSDAIGKLRVDQLQWLDWLQTICRVDDAQQTRLSAAKCMQPLYVKRTKLLRSAVSSSEDVLMLTRTTYLAFPSDAGATGMPTTYPGFDTLTAAWPEAQTDDADWAVWNKAMLAATQAIAKQAAGTSTTSTEWNAGDAAGNDAEAVTRILGIDQDRITTNTTIQLWRGAHPAESYGNTTWLLDAHRALRASDIFREDTPWQQALARACWQQLLDKVDRDGIYPELKGPDAPQLRDVVRSELNWHPEADGLRIDYPEYTVAPRFVHPDDSIVPWAVLKPYLQPSFTLPGK